MIIQLKHMKLLKKAYRENKWKEINLPFKTENWIQNLTLSFKWSIMIKDN